MSIKLGTTDLKELYLGNIKIKSAYFGNIAIYKDLINNPYYLTLLSNGYGSLIADALSGYNGNVVHLTATPNEDCHFIDYNSTACEIVGDDLTFGNSDCTAQANFGRNVHNVTTLTSNYGSISVNKNTGYSGDTFTLSNTPNADCSFANYSVTGATLTSNQFMMEKEDVSAQGSFNRNVHNVTLQNDGHGNIGANKTTGYSGDTITLSNTANSNYGFSGYTITGATLTGSNFKLGTTDVTAKAWFSAAPQSALYYSNKGISLTKNDYDKILNINCNTTAYRYININFNFYHKHNSTAAGFEIGSVTAAGTVRSLIYGYPNKYTVPIAYFMSGTGSYSSNSAYYGLFYPNTAYAKQTYMSTGQYIITHKTLDASANPKMKYIIDRNNRNYTAYVNNTNVGHGILSPTANINNIPNFVLTSYAKVTVSASVSGTNIRIAGFANFNDATAYNG